MTATELPDSSAPDATAARPSSREPADVGLRLAATANVGGSTDVDTRNHLRRALRILLLARRRDDGGAGRVDNI